MRQALIVLAVLALSQAALQAQTGPVAYDNTTNFTGFVFTQNPSANVGGNQVTFCDFDDINFTAGFANGQWSVHDIIWSTFNGSAGPVNARMGLVFYDDNGGGGAPGTRIGSILFNAAAIPAGGQAWIFTLTNPLAFPVLPNGGSFWAGLYFDDNFGATGATVAQMNSLGQFLYDPPTVGTSADVGWEPTAQGDPGVNNPTGGFFNFGGPPAVANNFFQFTVQTIPEPTTWALLGIGAFSAVPAWRRWRAGRAAKAQAALRYSEKA
jgi:hypothetical protein